MNTITIHGNLTRNVEISAKDGKAYAKFTVASNRGPKSDATDFFRVAAFGECVEDLRDLTKGTFVKVVGSIRLGEYGGKPTCEVIARALERKAREESPA